MRTRCYNITYHTLARRARNAGAGSRQPGQSRVKSVGMDMKQTSKRSRSNSELVFAALRKTHKPVTAYELLAKLRGQGVSAPPTIYRALERLVDQGLAHRLDSLNAFVACAHPHHGSSAMFSICEDCGSAEEFTDTALTRRIAAWARDTAFTLGRAVVEVRGRCADCSLVSS